MAPDRDLKALRAVARRLRVDRSFMGGIIEIYQKQTGIDDEELARELGCDTSDLIELALCRAPRIASEALFIRDVQAIAEYASCDWHQVAKLVRAALASEPDEGLLKAAEPSADFSTEYSKPPESDK